MFVMAILAGCSGDPQDKDYKDPSQLSALVSEGEGEYYLLDVRTDGEFSAGHIPTAQNIPYDVLADNLPTEDRGALIIVYCQSGNRSGIATRTLESLGFDRIIDFGGITRWPFDRVLPSATE